MKVRFLSNNEHKIAEVCRILEPHGIQVVAVRNRINEVQTQRVEDIASDKCLKAFKETGHPVVVEHTGLHISALNGLPGGLTQLFWDNLEADRFAALFGPAPDNSIHAKTVVAYCDTKTIRLFEGSIKGTIPAVPRGPRNFQWDCVFIPDGFRKTFAEMGDKKNSLSMRKHALDSFARFLMTGENNG